MGGRPLLKGGSATISDYKCSRIAETASNVQKRRLFSADKPPFLHKHHCLQFQYSLFHFDDYYQVMKNYRLLRTVLRVHEKTFADTE
jgi:hypothetical protein